MEMWNYKLPYYSRIHKHTKVQRRILFGANVALISDVCTTDVLILRVLMRGNKNVRRRQSKAFFGVFIIIMIIIIINYDCSNVPDIIIIIYFLLIYYLLPELYIKGENYI
jgi:Ca2+/Na+ antiporter